MSMTPARDFTERVNFEMVDLEPLDEEDRRWLFDTVTRHQARDRLGRGGRLLGTWGTALDDFVKVMPRDYRRVLEATRRAIDEGVSVDEAVMAAARG